MPSPYQMSFIDQFTEIQDFSLGSYFINLIFLHQLLEKKHNAAFLFFPGRFHFLYRNIQTFRDLIYCVTPPTPPPQVLKPTAMYALTPVPPKNIFRHFDSSLISIRHFDYFGCVATLTPLEKIRHFDCFEPFATLTGEKFAKLTHSREYHLVHGFSTGSVWNEKNHLASLGF